MKTLLLTALLGVPLISGAATNVPAGMTPEQYCAALEDTSASFMRMHQNGAPLDFALQLLAKNHGEFMRPIVLQAFSQPRFSTEPYQQRAVTDFGNSVRLACERQQAKP